MFNERISRLAFQTITVLFFFYQMKQSIMKYSCSPTSLTKLNVPNKGMVYEPYLVVCQTNQFKHSISKSFGYVWMTNFWGGILKSHDDVKVTWKGKTGNLSFSALSEELYDYDYSDIVFDQGKLGKQFLSIDLGMCAKLDDLGTKLMTLLYTNRTLKLLAVDPNTLTKVRITHDPKASITIGPRNDGMFDGADLLLEYSVLDNSINDGVGCRVYEHPNTYDKCVSKTLQVIFYSWCPNTIFKFIYTI